MTRPGPPDSTTSEDGSRFSDIDGDPYWSVTTALSIIGKEGLTWWAAGLAADYAFTQLPKLTAASITAPCGRTHNVCKQNRGDNALEFADGLTTTVTFTGADGVVHDVVLRARRGA